MTYQPNGNVASYQDSSNNAPIVGSWTYSYDSLNRLSGAQEQETPPVNPMTNYCWSYDAFGNRTSQDPATSPFQAGSGGASPCLPANPPPISYNTNNQINGGPEVAVYDAAGNITNDGTNQYLYNADGKICAVEWYDSQLHLTEMTGYIYDAEGNRVAKGAITTMSCDPSTNGFTTQADYVLDQAGHQLSEFRPGTGGAMVWQHTNVYASGELIATDDTTETHYYLNDWLGTRRVQTDYKGMVEQTCASLPYGDGETCAPTPTENLFTGKERDSESGNDYFGARYYASSMGRWLSPDDPILYQDKEDPQTWNLYSYVRNNPLNRVDPNGNLTVIIPGTGYSANDWNQNMKLVQEAKQEFHDSDVQILNWNSALGGGHIEAGAQQLINMVNAHSFAPDEQLNIIGHSRGGDVAIDAAGRLDHKVDNLITLSTPSYGSLPDYLPNVGNWINVTVTQDWVQLLDSTTNFDPRTFSGAHNFHLNANGYNHIAAHSAVWQNDSFRRLWWKYWQQNAGCQEYFDSQTNTVHGCQD